MQPQGSGLVNVQYFNNLVAQINAIDACGGLQEITNTVMADIQAQVDAIESQIAALAPLIVVPTDLGSVISWITAFIGPIATAYANYSIQLTDTLNAVNSLITAIENAEARILHCSVTIPPITT